MQQKQQQIYHSSQPHHRHQQLNSHTQSLRDFTNTDITADQQQPKPVAINGKKQKQKSYTTFKRNKGRQQSQLNTIKQLVNKQQDLDLFSNMKNKKKGQKSEKYVNIKSAIPFTQFSKHKIQNKTEIKLKRFRNLYSDQSQLLKQEKSTSPKQSSSQLPLQSISRAQMRYKKRRNNYYNYQANPIKTNLYVAFMQTKNSKNFFKRSNKTNSQSLIMKEATKMLQPNEFFNEYKKIIQRRRGGGGGQRKFDSLMVEKQRSNCSRIKNERYSCQLPSLCLKNHCENTQTQNIFKRGHRHQSIQSSPVHQKKTRYKPPFNPGPFRNENETTIKKNKRNAAQIHGNRDMSEDECVCDDQNIQQIICPNCQHSIDDQIQYYHSKSVKLKRANRIQTSPSQQLPKISNPTSRQNSLEKIKKYSLTKKNRTSQADNSKMVFKLLKIKTCFCYFDSLVKEKNNKDSSDKILKKQDSFQRLISSIKDHSRKNLKKSKQFPEISIDIPKLPKNQKQIAQFIKNYRTKKSIQRLNRTCEIKSKELVKSPNFNIQFEKGKYLYFGEVSQNKQQPVFDGKGILIKPGFLFQGVFQKGKQKKGILINQKGIYEGELKNQQRDGTGTFWWNGKRQMYYGSWSNGLRNGTGKWKSYKGDSYGGQWVNGKVQGYGVHWTPEGQRYSGHFQNFLKNGKGQQLFPNGDIYKGVFANGKTQGIGQYYFCETGMKYKGTFLKGLRHGKGKLSLEDQFVYEGEFKEDAITGQGKLTFSNKNTYTGQFQNGEYHGLGTLYDDSSKTSTKGIWKHGELESNECFKSKNEKR